MMTSTGLKTLLGRVLGTGVLLISLAFFISRAPFLTGGTTTIDSVSLSDEAVDVRVPLEASAGALRLPTLPPSSDKRSAMGLNPAFGLFDASFAATDQASGFKTSEHRVPGSCSGAGRRYMTSECPSCAVIGDPNSAPTEMLLWHQSIEGKPAIRAVTTNCMRVSTDGIPIVGTLEFGDSPVDLGSTAQQTLNSSVPILSGGKRVASIKLGGWSATFDTVARPSAALDDMADALGRRGWREVSDPETYLPSSFEGQRVFTNVNNAVCVISLTRQNDEYQLLTIVNGQA